MRSLSFLSADPTSGKMSSPSWRTSCAAETFRGNGCSRSPNTTIASAGRGPINDQNRGLVAALERELARNGPPLPVYWGNRNWHPLLADTLREMAINGVRRALAFVTSGYGSYSGCRQYLDDIARARQEVGRLRSYRGQTSALLQPPGVSRSDGRTGQAGA